MLTEGIIHRYGIVGVWDTYAAIDTLFSGNVGYTEGEDGKEYYTGMKDPMLEVDSLIGEVGAEWSDVTVAISANGSCVIQVVQFRDKMGYDKYKSDGVVIFNDKR